MEMSPKNKSHMRYDLQELLTDLPRPLAVVQKLTSGRVSLGLESLRINRGILILVGVNSIKLFNVVYSIMNTFVLVFCIYLL